MNVLGHLYLDANSCRTFLMRNVYISAIEKPANRGIVLVVDVVIHYDINAEFAIKNSLQSCFILIRNR